MSYMDRLVLMHVADTPGERHAVSRIVEDAIDERTTALLARAERAEADAATLREALVKVLGSAFPSQDYQPAMFEAWQQARAALTSGGPR